MFSCKPSFKLEIEQTGSIVKHCNGMSAISTCTWPNVENTYHAGLHGARCLVLGIVRNIRNGVEQAISAMSRVAPDDATPLSSSYGLTTSREMTSVRNEDSPKGKLGHVSE